MQFCLSEFQICPGLVQRIPNDQVHPDHPDAKIKDNPEKAEGEGFCWGIRPGSAKLQLGTEAEGFTSFGMTRDRTLRQSEKNLGAAVLRLKKLCGDFQGKN